MQIRGPLMKEHRVIEKMVAILENHLKALEKGDKVDTHLIRDGVHFFRFYADRTHHGKEEDILFARLKDKPLSDVETVTMNKLIDEHVFARTKVKALEEANQKYEKGDDSASNTIINILHELIDLYPQHIDTEDNHFFEPVMRHFNEEEQKSILNQYDEFDRTMIHERYAKMVEKYQ